MRKLFIALLSALLCLLLSVSALAADGLSTFQETQTYQPGMFSDVKAGSWYEAGVRAVYTRGIMNGTGGKAFAPSQTITWAQAAAIAARIHAAVLEAETVLHSRFPALHPRLPANLTFVTSEELFDMYPGLAPEEREQAFVKKHRAVFVKHIGWPLGDGRPHGVRAPDYDDWSLNGDLLYYHPELDCCLEVSSMGIRVDASSMFRQLNAADARARLDLPFHREVMEEKLPLTIGGGIGQSRLCMLLLGKAHIGEVQASVWDPETLGACQEAGVVLL